MRIPEPLFPILNRAMRILLRSPLHGVMSDNVMVIHFIGRKTGRRRATPVRYLRESDDALFCLTGQETGWWHNFKERSIVELRLAGRRVSASALATTDDAVRKEAAIRRMLARFPGDAAYHGIIVKRGQEPSPEQINEAVARDVLVTFALGVTGVDFRAKGSKER